jgi:hypothetical protein
MRVSRIVSSLLGALMMVMAPAAAFAAGTWSITDSMSTARDAHTATLLPDGRVFVTGGRDGGSIWAGAEIYDPALGTWSSGASMSAARSFHTATLLPNGRVLVTGGSGGSILASAEIYTLATDTWSPTASMSTARGFHTATLLLDGRVLVTGGISPSYVTSAEIYNPATGIWSLTGSMSTARSPNTATLLSDGRVLVTGGYDGSSYLASAEIYNPATGTWSLTDSMSTASVYHTATLLPDGRVLVTGGFNGSSFSARAEIYDPALGTWSLTASMSTARGFHRATLLPDSRVLVTGGSEGSSYLASAEIYGPAPGTWSLTGSMSAARGNHRDTLLPDGRVLVSGGYNGSSYLASAETFDCVAPVITGTTASDPMTIGGGNANVSATFTDGPGQTHTCSISWGDGSPDTPGTVSETNGSGTCTGSHSYAAQMTPIVYEVTITVTDDCGAPGSGVTYVVLYDPNGGFVTGAGWINSPPEAYPNDPAAIGRANFGFVSRYRKGSTIPEGSTNFHFNAADFKFDSDTYEWLVVSGPKARYRGTGSVNGIAGYAFELTAWDGQVNGGGGVDKFRIKIWQGSPGNVLYDNERGTADGADPITILGGGSIVIHKK